MISPLKNAPLLLYRKLSMILPQEVKDKLGNAKWDATQEVLIVTLPINQEATITGMLR